jgi:anti-sigma regulatory factor (Ser/Thr protein kinase)
MIGSATSETHLPCDRSAPRLARRWMSEQLNPLGLERELHDGAVLLVSELVSDVILRAHHAPVVTLRIEADEILVGVEDAWGEGPPLDGAERGVADSMGRAIVDRVADRWGACYEPDGTQVVWFALQTVA